MAADTAEAAALAELIPVARGLPDGRVEPSGERLAVRWAVQQAPAR